MAKKRIRPSATSGRGPGASSWLLLLYQLPVKPSKLRVMVWRRLQKLGALQVKGSAYVLPNSPQAREDFEWIRAEVISMKGEATVFAADSVDTWGRDEIVAGFQAARAKGYESLRHEIQNTLAGGRKRRVNRPWNQHTRSAVRALRERWNELQAIDFFGAPGHDDARAALERLERSLLQPEREQQQSLHTGGLEMPEKYRNRIWLTRPRPGVDRMSSAWLIQRFIDPKARFAFAEKPKARSKSMPFDMYGVEFSHHGDACTFETLVSRFAIKNPGVKRLARIVHNLDLKDDKFQAPEAVAVGALVEGLRQMYRDDRQLLHEGVKMFEALYRSWIEKPVA